MNIEERVRSLLKEIPENVKVVAATKARSVDEILRAIDAGIEIIGENYVQEALKKYETIGDRVEWHFIGHLQKNKVKYVVPRFDMIETLDSLELARVIDKHAEKNGKTMPVLIEVNIAEEPQKYGISPSMVKDFIKDLTSLRHIKVEGLMTMGPLVENPEDIRPFFKRMRELFEESKQILPEMKYLSMGMSDTYRVAIEEGANIIRVGTLIFGPRS